MAVKTVAHFSGYLNRPDATAAAWAGDFLRSDDIGVLEKDGRLRIIDRKNGLIISGGENVYAAEVGAGPDQPSAGPGRHRGR